MKIIKKMNLHILFFTLLFFFISIMSYGQEEEERELNCQGIMTTMPSVNGNTGMILTPTARLINKKDIVFSVNSLPYSSAFSPENTYKGSSGEFYQMLYSVGFNIFPFLEVNAGFRVNNGADFSNDFEKERSLKMRLHLFSERRILPSIVIGVHDVFSSDRPNAESYIVASKGFNGLFDVDMDLHLGYGARENDIFWLGNKESSHYTNRIACQVRMLDAGEAFSFGVNYTLTPGEWFEKRKPCVNNETNSHMSDKVDEWLLSLMDKKPHEEEKEKEKEKMLAEEEAEKADSLMKEIEEIIDEKIDDKLKKELEDLEKTLDELAKKLNECCQGSEMEKASNSLGIVYFGFNVKNINASDKASIAKIEKIATVLRENPNFKLKIIGHTDEVGSNKINDRIAMKRARAVENILINDFKIDKNRVTVISKGETEPRSKDHSRNRRVEFALER
ncbi:MAG: hypothetical protein B6I24_01765 [Bacteroidetes bacterium 4572_128]|nr:MAG: hypothetical protein B6I24_01765 [Bacteroidetes bacterium 4572_128]